MPIDVTCPEGHQLRVPDKLAGKTARCPKCSRTFEVPDLESIAAEIDVIDAEEGESAESPQKERRRKKRKAKSEPNWVLLGGAALAAILVVGLAGVYFAGGFSSDTDSGENADAGGNWDENPQAAVLKSDIEAAIAAIDQKKYKSFIYDFMPRAAIEKFERTRQSKKPESEWITEKEAATLRDQLQACLSGEVSFNRDEIFADVDYVVKPKVVLPSAPPELPRGFGTGPPTPTSGLGGDLPKMLAAAVQLLESGQVEEFVRNVYPAAELARISAADAMKQHLFRIESNPQMVEAMLRELKEAAAAEAVMSDGGNLATVTLSPLVAKDPERVFKFEKVAGHWRFFDSDSPNGLHAEYVKLVKQPLDALTVPGVRGVFFFEKSGKHWRIRKEPETYPILD